MIKFFWILLPLAAIALFAFTEWLKFKRHASSIGESTVELSASVSALQDELDELRQERLRLIHRIQNLEAIVTSEAWETIRTDPDLAKARLPESPPMDEEDHEKVERLAKRLRS